MEISAIAASQVLFGFALGLGLWFVVHLTNRAWLGFWSFLRG